MQLGTIKTAVKDELGYGGDSGTEDAAITRWANRAVRDILIKTHVRVRELSMALTSGTDEYALDTDILQLLSLKSYDGSDDREMEPLTLSDINVRRIRGDLSSGPARYYSLQGSDYLILYPTPGSGESVRGEYVPKPTEMSSDTHDTSNTTYGGIPVEYDDVVELYVLYHAARADDHQGSQRGRQYQADYLRRVQEMRAELNRKRGITRPHLRVRRRNSSVISSDPSRAWL